MDVHGFLSPFKQWQAVTVEMYIFWGLIQWPRDEWGRGRELKTELTIVDSTVISLDK